MAKTQITYAGNPVKFSKTEIIALHFATALIAVRENKPDCPGKTNAAVMRDAFAFARAFEKHGNG
jgi:hypothetical protein